MVVYAHNGFLWFTIMAQDEINAFTVRLPKELADYIQVRAWEERRSKHSLVVIIIEDWIKEDASKKKSPEGLPPPHLTT